MQNTSLFALVLLAGMATTPVWAQITVLDSAQDGAGTVVPQANPAPPSACGAGPLTIARMNWPSASVLAEIHALVLQRNFDCQTQVLPGDLSATASSMGSSGQPSIAPEMWVTRVADLWNRAVEAQAVRAAGPTFSEATLEGWFVPAYMADVSTSPPAAASLATSLPTSGTGEKIRFISCPADWACSVINRNLVRAHGLTELVDLVEPSNRFEMDRLIAEAVSRREAFLFYYWQPNAVLAQLDFVSVDMGAYDAEAMSCLAAQSCAMPVPSAFAPEQVVAALAESVFTDMPAIAGYFQRATMPVAEMNRLLARLSEPGATAEMVADQFVRERSEIWAAWIGAGTP